MLNKIGVLIIFPAYLLFPQTSYISSPFERTAENMYEGITESITWYDLPVAAMMIFKGSLFVQDNSKLITFSAFDFDKDIQGSIGKNGRKSIGSMDPNTIPTYIMLSRAALTIAGDMIFPESFSKDDYQKIFLFYKSVTYTHIFTEAAKNLVKRKRPDRSDTRSFFSGHSSISFAAASFLYRELDDYIDGAYPSADDKLLCSGLKAASFGALYGWAGYVAYSRLHDNKHYLSDILLGAAAGTVISNLIYQFYLEKDDSILNNLSVGMINNNPSLLFNLSF